MKFIDRHFFISTFLFLTVIFLYSCSNPNAITDKEFDRKAWQLDRNGCEAVRVEMLDNLEKIKPKLEGLDEIDLRKILGKPDFAELYSRNQKFYTYYIDASENCQNEPSKKLNQGERRVLQIRFDAINAVNEIVVIREERNKK